MTPPRGARWLLRRVLPDPERTALLDELQDEFDRLAAAHGARQARRWFWRQALRSAIPLALSQSRRRRSRQPFGALLGLRQAFRRLAHDSSLTLISILTLGIAMLLVTVILAVADATILDPLPYPAAHQLVSVTIDVSLDGYTHEAAPSLEDVRRWQSAGALDSVVAEDDVPFGCVLRAEQPIRVQARRVTESPGKVYGLPARLGRDFVHDDMHVAAPTVAMLGFNLYQAQFGGSDVIGGVIRCDDEIATIVGVLPPGFEPHVDLWLPLRLTGPAARRRGTLTVLARISDKSVSHAEAALAALVSPGDPNTGTRNVAGVRLRSLKEGVVQRHRPTVQALTAGVGVGLLVACVNVTGLLIARNARRRREFAIRLVIGATRAQLVRESLLEGVLLSAGSAAIGVFAASQLMDLLVTVLPISLPVGAVSAWDLRVIAGVFALATVIGLVFAFLMISQLRIADLPRELATGSGRVGPALSRRGAQSVIAGQVALTVVLVALGSVVLRSYARLLAVDLGFDPRGVVAFSVSPVEPASAAEKQQFYAELTRRIAAIPGVEAVSLVDHFPLSDTSVTISASSSRGHSSGVGYRQILGNYFQVLGVQSIRGALTAAEPLVHGSAIVNESAARRMFDAEAVGESLTVGKRTFNIAAVVPDFVHGGPLEQARPEVFVPYDPTDSLSRIVQAMTVVVRTRGAERNLPKTLEEVVRGIGHPILLGDIRAADEWLAERVATPRQRTMFFGSLGAVGALLMIVGVFSATAYVVARRRNEIGVRLALGASPSRVVRDSLKVAAIPVLLGLAGGLYLATFATPAVRSFLFHTPPNDPVMFAAVAVMVGGSAFLAAWIPARRAADVDPVASIRDEGWL